MNLSPLVQEVLDHAGLASVREKVLAGERLSYDDGVALFECPDGMAVGALANLVVWSGDPFEVTTWAERAFIRGREVNLETRQDLLTERYRTLSPSSAPAGP